MARRNPPPSPKAVADAAGVPEWVRSGWRITAAMRDLAGTGASFAEVCDERRRRQAAAEQWCAERGLSFCMTALGWKLPSPDEIARGLTLGPEDLPPVSGGRR